MSLTDIDVAVKGINKEVEDLIDGVAQHKKELAHKAHVEKRIMQVLLLTAFTYIIMAVVTYGHCYANCRANNDDKMLAVFTAAPSAVAWPLYWSIIMWEDKTAKVEE